MNPHQRLQLKVLVALGGVTCSWLVLTEFLGPKEDDIEVTILAGIEPSMVLGLSLHTTGHQIDLVREGSAWHLQAPTNELADQGRVNAIVADLSTIKAKPVDGMAPTSANIGLVRLALELEGETPRVLLFGRKSPVGDGRYVSLGSVVHLTTTPLPPALLNSKAELGSPDPVSGITPADENEPPR